MVEKIRLKDEVMYECMKCGRIYRELNYAKRYENWRETYKNCNIKILKDAVNIKWQKT